MENLRASFLLSNSNPQKGDIVTVTDTSTNQTGAAKTWKLNGSIVSQSVIDAGLTFGSGGTKTLELTLSDGTNSDSFSRSFFVGDLTGAAVIQKGSTALYSDANIPDAIFSISNERINFASPINGTIVTSTIPAVEQGAYMAHLAALTDKNRNPYDRYYTGGIYEGYDGDEIVFTFNQNVNVREINLYATGTSSNTQLNFTDNAQYASVNTDVHYWNGAAWVLIQNVAGGKHWKQILTNVTTTKIKVTNLSGSFGRSWFSEIEIFSANGNYIDSKGWLRTGKSETVNVKAQTPFYKSDNAPDFRVDEKENLIIPSVSDKYAYTNADISRIGDAVTFKYRHGLMCLILRGAGGYFYIYNGTLYGNGGSYIGGVSVLENDDVMFETLSNTAIALKVNNVLAYTYKDLPPSDTAMFAVATQLAAYGKTFPRPVYNGAGIKYSTGQVTVYESVIANFTVPAEIPYNSAITTNNTSTGTVATRVWKIGTEIIGTTANVSFTRPPGTYQLDLVLTDGFGGNSTHSETFTVLDPPPVFISTSPLPYAQVGNPYSTQLKVKDVIGSGSFEAVFGNLPDGAMNASGLVNIPAVGANDYTFGVRYTSTNGAIVQETFTIPVSEYAYRNLEYDRQSYQRTPIITATEFPVLTGSIDIAEDAPLKYEYEFTAMASGQQNFRDLEKFFEDHRLRQPFLWYDADWDELKTVYLVSSFPSKRRLNYGGFQITLKDV